MYFEKPGSNSSRTKEKQRTSKIPVQARKAKKKPRTGV
jgi:hypothetical protein